MKVFLCSAKFGGCDHVGFNFRSIGIGRLCPECGEIDSVCEVDPETVTAVTDSPAIVEEVRRVFAHEEAEAAIRDEEDAEDVREMKADEEAAELREEIRMADLFEDDTDYDEPFDLDHPYPRGI